MTGRLKFLKEKGKTVAKLSLSGMKSEKEMLAFVKRHEKEIMRRLKEDDKKQA